MTRVALTGGYYVTPALIANGQRCLNLFPEPNPPDSPVPFTDYGCPGSRTVGTLDGGGIRCTYTATNGQLFVVAGRNVYYVNSAFDGTLLGMLDTNPGTLVSMADNGTTIVVVDGSSNGYTIDLVTHAFAAIVDDAFYGAVRVDFLSTFFLFNKPGTGIFYASDSQSTTFDPLWFATKITYADPLATLIVLGQEFYLLGAQASSEVWVLNDNPDFPFQRMPAVMINHGIVAPYSLAKIGTQIFWLSRDLNGRGVVLRGQNYEGQRISTFALEAAIQSYGDDMTQAIGYCFQMRGHQFYRLVFPQATWEFDVQTGLWHECCWLDEDGAEQRVRGQCMAFAYGKNIAGDWETGTLRELTLDLDTDDDVPMLFLRGFPHMINDGDRVVYRQFIADLSVGAGTGTLDDPPLCSLRWSDTRGVSWGNAITASTGRVGEYLTQVQFQRLGLARDRVFELSWSGDGGLHALNGAFVETIKAAT